MNNRSWWKQLYSVSNPLLRGFFNVLIYQGKKRLVEEEKKRDGGTVALASTSAILAAAAGAAATEPVSRKRPVYDKTDIAPR